MDRQAAALTETLNEKRHQLKELDVELASKSPDVLGSKNTAEDESSIQSRESTKAELQSFDEQIETQTAELEQLEVRDESNSADLQNPASSGDDAVAAGE